jgi:hypothetical protein
MTPLGDAMRAGEPGEKALRTIGQTIGAERMKFADYILRCRAQGYIAFDDDPLEIVSLFVAMAQGEWSLRLSTGMLDQLTDKMIEDHAAGDADLPQGPCAGGVIVRLAEY